MKKVLLSLASVVLLLSSCGSDENLPDRPVGAGELSGSITFEGVAPKAAVSKAIPITSWSNIKQVQLFLYKADGTVAYSRIIKPTADGKFNWNDVPAGTGYTLALVANINNTQDNIATTLGGSASTAWTEFTDFNVRTKKVNSDLFIDLKAGSFPAGHTFITGQKAYEAPSEIFTVYQTGVDITEGVKKEIGPLALKRSIAMTRILIDKEVKPTAKQLDKVDFANTSCFIALENMPVGLGLKLGTFGEGIYDGVAFNNDRVLIGASGATTYKTQNPASGYKNPAGGAVTILGSETNSDGTTSKYTLWNDIQVLPNVSAKDYTANGVDVKAANRYKVRLSGRVPAGYIYENGVEAPTGGGNVYWYGTIKGVFTPNTIREVKIVLKTAGLPSITPIEKEGSLEINVGTPLDWNSVIESEGMEI